MVQIHPTIDKIADSPRQKIQSGMPRATLVRKTSINYTNTKRVRQQGARAFDGALQCCVGATCNAWWARDELQGR